MCKAQVPGDVLHCMGQCDSTARARFIATQELDELLGTVGARSEWKAERKGLTLEKLMEDTRPFKVAQSVARKLDLLYWRHTSVVGTTRSEAARRVRQGEVLEGLSNTWTLALSRRRWAAEVAGVSWKGKEEDWRALGCGVSPLGTTKGSPPALLVLKVLYQPIF